MLPTIQLVFSNFYLGIALGALDFSAKYTTTSTRVWPFGGDNKDKPTDEFYVLERYGNFKAHLRAAEALATDTGLRVTAGVFEVTGARATSIKVGLDRFWRDVRTHSLHDPVAYKNRELGRYTLLDEILEVTWYT